MIIKSAVPIFMSKRPTCLFRLLLLISTLTPLSVLSQELNPAESPANNTHSQTSTPEAKARPVEIGPGGNIKLEKKYRAKAESLFEWHAHLLWESRYVTEGRDNLSGKSLASVSSEFEYNGLSIIPWIADSPDTSYSEFNLNMVYGLKLADRIELYAGYNHIQGRERGVNSNDNEVSLDLAFNRIKKFHLLASIYHSFEADGSFIELAAKQGLKINLKTNISIKGILGVNSGYVTDGHKGLNHFQLTTNIAYQADTNMELYAYAGYNLAIDRDTSQYAGDQLLDDFLWTGLGFTYRF